MTPEQRSISQRLERLLGPEMAQRYRDCCRIATDERLESPAPLLAHGLRELESMLRQGLVTPELLAEVTPAEEVTAQADRRGTHALQVRGVLRWLSLPADGDVGRRWLSFVREDELKLHGHAHRRSFLRPGRLDESFFQDVWQSFSIMLHGLLSAIERRYISLLARVGELARMADKQRAVRELTQAIPLSIVVQRRLFGQLRDPAWLPLLADTALFTHPPESRIDEDSNAAVIQPWPPGQLLASAAQSTVPEILDRVCSLIGSLAGSEHLGVRDSLLRAILALPDERAENFVATASAWLDSPRHSAWIVNDAVQLVAKLARGNRGIAALQLFRSVFRIERGAEPEPERPQTLFGRSDYGYALNGVTGALVAAGDRQVMEVLIGLLRQAGEITGRMARDPANDYTYLWRHWIADHEDNLHELFGSLVNAVRDAAYHLSDNDPAQIGALVIRLEAEEYPILRRVALHILARHAGSAITMASERLLDRGLLTARWCAHEYGELAIAHVGRLSESERSQLFGMVMPTAVEVSTFERRYLDRNGQPPSEADVNAFRDVWFRDHVAEWRDALPPQWRDRLAQTVGRHGDAQPIGIVVRSIATSPRSADELTAMPLSELLAYLSTWTPERGDRRLTPAALGHQLRRVAARAPQRLADAATQFMAAEACFVRNLLAGLDEAAKEQRPFPWSPVLALVSWVLEQPDPNQEAQAAEEREGWDPSWQSCRHTIADLLCTGLREGPAEFTDDVRPTVWALIERLGTSALPSPEEEAENQLIDNDPYLA